MRHLYRTTWASISVLCLALSALSSQAQGTAFIYNGRLDEGTNLANGTYDITFTLFATNSGGQASAGPVTNLATAVSHGMFSATIDFGAGVFTGSNYWLELGVRTNGASNFEVLSPRQAILPAPYAIYSETSGNAVTAMVAGTAGSVSAANINGPIPLANLPPGLITNNTASLSLGSSNSVAALTVSPQLPVSAAGTVPVGSVPYGMAVAGRYAFVVNYTPTGSMEVVDFSSPSAPVVVATVPTQGGSKSVAVAGRYAYVANYGDNAHSLQVFDVSDPAAPTSVGSVSAGYPCAVVVGGHYAYVANLGSTSLEIFDIADPTAPVLVGSAGTGGATALALSGRYVYLVNSTAPKILQIIDVSSPSAPVVVGSVATTGYPGSVAVSGRYAYVMCDPPTGAETLQIFDVSNPATPVSVSSTVIGTGWCFSSVVADRYLYLANYTSASLSVMDISNPLHPVKLGTFATGSYPNSLALSGRYVYVANYGDGTVQAFDLGGAYLQQLEAGTVEAGSVQTRDTVTVGNNLDVRGGLTVSASARISGGLSVNNGTITAAHFNGDGSGLLNVPAGAINGGVTTNILIGGHTFYYTNGVLMNVQ